MATSRKTGKALKRPKYCPELAQAMAKRRKEELSAMMELQGAVERAKNFPKLLTTTNEDQLHELNDAAVELLLLSTFGLKGLLILIDAIRITPSNTPDRNGYIFSLMQQAGFLLDKQYCRICISLLERLNIFSLHSSEMVSNTYSEGSLPQSASPLAKVQLILTPPNDTCINLECSHQGKRCSLIKNHNPTFVTVFTLSGPIVGQKFTLRCSGCSTIYNYSQFGKKHTDGECYYSCRRDLIEISDTIYAERELYNFFNSLR